MSEPIKAGDLVQVMQTCCGIYSGYVYRVDRVGHPDNLQSCPRCDKWSEPSWLFAYNDGDGKPHKVPVQWLKRIPPLPEFNDVKRDEEITA